MTKAKSSRKTSDAKKASRRIGNAEYLEKFVPLQVELNRMARWVDGN